MACMEHQCTECECFIMNNTPRMECPKCGAPMHGVCDEVPERPDPIDYEAEE